MEKPHKKLDAWKLSMDLVIDVYRETEKFPNRERYGLLDQIRRATISIPSNIAEGAARKTKKESLPISSTSLRAPSVSWIPKLNWQDGSVTSTRQAGDSSMNAWSESIKRSVV